MPNPNPSPIFFVPNEAYLFVRHNSGKDLFATIQNTSFFKKLQDKAGAKIVEDNDSTIAFPPKGDDRLWLVKITFNLPSDFGGSAKLLGYILDANRAIRDAKGALPLDIAGISPNWITEASQDPAPNGGGGPGRHHLEATVDDYNQYHGFNLPDRLSRIGEGKERINVYVLDSFPDGTQTLPVTPGISATVDVGPVRDLCPHTYYDPAGPGPCDPNQMPSHGLFAANIIRHIAKNANVQYVPILNKKAIGTMISLTCGLFAVYNAQKGNDSSFVVNMSLAYPNPFVIAAMMWKQIYNTAKANGLKPDVIWNDIFGDISNRTYANSWPQLSAQQSQQILGGKSPYESGNAQSLNNGGDAQLKQLVDDIQELINCSVELTQAAQDFGLDKGTFIASAGNDRFLTQLYPGLPDLPDNLPIPDYPAIDCHVIGVGALDKSGQMTSYTNMADVINNTYAGMWTFGGDYDYEYPSTTFPDPTGGIIGEADPNRYVWWAGTSFAAPIVSGVQALLLSVGDSLFEKVGEAEQDGTCSGFRVKSDKLNDICTPFNDPNGQNLGWQLLVTQGPV